MADELPTWAQRAGALLDEVIAHGDENGAVANAQPDDLRDALDVAADRLRVLAGHAPRNAWWLGIRLLTAEVWELVAVHRLDARSPAADAALDMRDMIDTGWWPDVAEERERLRSGGHG